MIENNDNDKSYSKRINLLFLFRLSPISEVTSPPPSAGVKLDIAMGGESIMTPMRNSNGDAKAEVQTS